LHGSIAPLNNIGPDQLYLYDIAKRLSGVKELILATNPTMEGEATALFIAEMIRQSTSTKEVDLQISRIGHGLPIGADIEYADGVTLARALEGRRQV
jgi:recombination protein RecR